MGFAVKSAKSLYFAVIFVKKHVANVHRALKNAEFAVLIAIAQSDVVNHALRALSDVIISASILNVPKDATNYVIELLAICPVNKL